MHVRFLEILLTDYAYILNGIRVINIGEDLRGKLAWPFINHVNYQLLAMLFGSPELCMVCHFGIVS